MGSYEIYKFHLEAAIGIELALKKINTQTPQAKYTKKSFRKARSRITQSSRNTI